MAKYLIGLITQLHISTTFCQNRGLHPLTLPSVATSATRISLTKNLPPLFLPLWHSLTFHFFDSPSFLSFFFFVYLSFSVSPLFPLYLIFFSTLLYFFLSFLCLSLLQFVFDFFSLSSLFLSQLFLVGLNRWLLGLKWGVVSVVAWFGLVMMGFGGGHLGVGWVFTVEI